MKHKLEAIFEFSKWKTRPAIDMGIALIVWCFVAIGGMSVVAFAVFCVLMLKGCASAPEPIIRDEIHHNPSAAKQVHSGSKRMRVQRSPREGCFEVVDEDVHTLKTVCEPH